ncbi:MAG: hypothetical protein J5I90_21675 [Caldilineales bacterium]|nr:hypothetical protein [Caldilineales bacterium]
MRRTRRNQQVLCWGWLAALVLAGMLLGPAKTAFAAESEPVGRWQPNDREQNLAGSTAEYRVYLPFVDHSRLPDSFTLIDDAQKRGEFDDETALIYAVFATFGDARLPWRFHGDNSGVIDSDAVSEATLRFADLSPTTRETLVPFLVPPVYAGSWYDLRVNGQIAASGIMTGPVNLITDRCKELAQGLFASIESDHFVIWYPTFDNSFWLRANQISINLEQRIHPILTDLFREPLGDAGLGCNPSDGRLDVYMVYDPIPGYVTTNALVSVYPGTDCKVAPSYMLVLRQGYSETSTVAHEFMHMIQYSYDPASECFHAWWMEATAKWAEDYFETVDAQPDVQNEQRYAKYYLESTLRWLIDTEGLREYGAYLWPFYLSHYTGSYHPEIIAEIFSATEDAAKGNLYQVINDTIEGGWAERWSEFAVYNLNLAPHNEYEQWDDLKMSWDTWKNKVSTTDVELFGYPYIPHEIVEVGQGALGYRIRDLAIAYENIKVDKAVGLLAFENAFRGVPDVRVQAMIKRAGQDWQGPEDWSSRKWTVVCADDPAGRVEEIILIISNSNWQRLTNSSRATGPVRMIASDLSCVGWQGSSDWQIEGESHDRQGQVNYTIRGEATPKFTLSKLTQVGDLLQLEYQPTGGSASWMTTYTSVDFQTGNTASCTRTDVQTLTPDLGGLLIVEDLRDNLEGDEFAFSRKFFASGLVPAPDRCPGLDTWTHIPWLTTDIPDTGLLPWPGQSAGKLQGTSSQTITGEDYSNTTTSTWNLRALTP